MKKYYLILLYVSFINLYGCNKIEQSHKVKEKMYVDTIKNPNMKIDEQAIKNYYKKSLSGGSQGEEEEDYFVTEKDVDLMIPVLLEGLKNNGFKFLDKEAYRNKLKDIFNISYDTKCPGIFRHSNFFTYVVQDCKQMGMNLTDCNENAGLMEFLYDDNVFFVNNYSTLTSLPKVELFTELKNDKVVINVPTNIIYRNLFLFNDDKSKLLWLLKNDTRFMKNLVKEFGYDKNSKINEYIINHLNEKPLDSIEELYKYIASKDCDNKLEIRTLFLNSYTNLYNNSKNINEVMTLKYLSSSLISDTLKGNHNNLEKMKILAYLANTYDPLFKQYHNDGQNWGEMTVLADYRDYLDKEEWEKVKQEYQKNNYYNLPSLKAMVEYADMFDIVGAPD